MPAKTTTAIIFPFDLFGSPGASEGAELIGDALEEMIEDNRREAVPTRALAYTDCLRIRRYTFETERDYRRWRTRARKAVQRLRQAERFFLWITGNHLGVMPVLEEFAGSEAETLVVQWDAHLDIHAFADCTSELSHGNFLRHCQPPVRPLINVGHRDLLLTSQDIEQYYTRVFSAAELAIQSEPALQWLGEEARRAQRVFLDIDLDVLDPGSFAAVGQPVPFGLTPTSLLRTIEAVWSDRVVGVSLSEFRPAGDQNDQALALVVWLLEYLLLKRHEPRV